MLPLILLGAGVWAWHKHQKHKRAHIPSNPGLPTPAAAKVHGELMAGEDNPNKLEKAAEVFRRNGCQWHAHELAGKASQIRKIAKVVPDIVNAARAPDQNAIGMIAAVRESAAKGDPRAIVTAKLIAKYCEKNPAPELGPLGEMKMR